MLAINLGMRNSSSPHAAVAHRYVYGRPAAAGARPIYGLGGFSSFGQGDNCFSSGTATVLAFLGLGFGLAAGFGLGYMARGPKEE